VDRFVRALTNPGDLVFDPFSGVGSAGVAALINGRRFWGCEADASYVAIALGRLQDAKAGVAKYRPIDKPLYDPRQSSLSVKPER
jgi:adenine-specific DNA-methyltransferase